jgi:protein disulfide-isomerase A6
MRRPLLFLAILFVALVVLRLYSQSTEFFQSGGSAEGPTVIIAKAEWCGHCKAAAPEFDKLARASPIRLKNGTSATVKILDADSDSQEIQQLPQKIRGYPTIMVLHGSDVKEYPGERTYQGVTDFLNML